MEALIIELTRRLATKACYFLGLSLLLFLAGVAWTKPAEEDVQWPERRENMVRHQIVSRGIKDIRVLKAMRKVQRHLFVDGAIKALAYEDTPLPIGHGQTISQPFIVAFMTQAAAPKASDRVLEIGTGSGYQTAILAELSREIYSIEIVKELALGARELLELLGYRNIHIQHGDGYAGWPEESPFDVILVTAAAPEIPEKLLEQLAVEGRMVLPVGDKGFQELHLVTKTRHGVVTKKILPVSFVPMVKA